MKVYLETTLPGDESVSRFGPFEDNSESWGDTYDELYNTLADDGADVPSLLIDIVKEDDK